MDELPGGIRRVTLPLPVRPGHVHSYLLPGEDGWTLVDTGLGLPDASERWAHELAQAGGRVGRICITHFHPDHVGAGADLVTLTGAPVLQGAVDYAQCLLAWGSAGWTRVLAEWFASHGVPAHLTEELVEQGAFYRPFIRFHHDPLPLRAGDLVEGWEVVAAPGHADGQVTLLAGGTLVAADHLLGQITPTVGLWPQSRPDPLGDYLASLEHTIELAPRRALPGHGDPIDDPVARARELIEHHRGRLAALAGALRAEPRSGYELSLSLFGSELGPAARRFAVAETLSHLERLAREGLAERVEHGSVRWSRS